MWTCEDSEVRGAYIKDGPEIWGCQQNQNIFKWFQVILEGSRLIRMVYLRESEGIVI